MRLFGDDPLDLRPRGDGEQWYVAASTRATFAFCLVDGRVTKVAPIGRRWMQGRAYDERLAAKLQRNGYTVTRMSA